MTANSERSDQNVLISLSEGVYLSKPSRAASTSSRAHAPNVILLFAWMGAKLPHIAKYVQAYTELYPDAAKIVVRSEASFFWSSTKAKRAYLAPVVETLELLGCLPPAVTLISKSIRAISIEPILPYPNPRVLVHAFSNGGSSQLTTLSEILADRTTSEYYTLHTVSLPASAVVLDSCPGNGGLDKTLRAFASVIHNPVLRPIVKCFIYALFFYVHSRARLRSLLSFILPFYRSSSKQETTIDHMKARLHSKQLLPWLGPRTTRLYIYSDADDIITSDEVEAHASVAKEIGLEVRMEKFEGSQHVSHARMNPERYWGAVRNVWEAACSDAGLI
ncbi:hypothetical protein BDN70DRAFT_918590 [Pholiota conissans]|uniref:Uncharacterized protein n=1 Tax=Pholiota conissans TaxID=109636 RepID=A0A9P6D489_9AGAR|nr:hypothetical protein BDN70DRAFT_918590 [Pholiota conissans]